MNFPNPPTFNEPLPQPSTPVSSSLIDPGPQQAPTYSVNLRQRQPSPGPPRDLHPQGLPLHQQHPGPSLPPQTQRQSLPSPLASSQLPQQQLLYPNQVQPSLQFPPQLSPLPPPQQLIMMNGMNGAGNMPAGAVVGLPTQVAQQAELNYIYGMVEELSRQLAENKRALEEVVTGVGRVRHRARANSMGNEELIDAALEDINAQEPNMDTLVSLLTEALEKAKFSRDANAALLSQYASVVATMLKQFHEYKAKHVTDVSVWHRSYRAQLAEARSENSKLREQIWEMQEHAGHANELLREFRSKYEEDETRKEMAVQNKALRQELRFWKRMAMPEVAEDDPSWSDDDDLIDPEEKRLRELERRVAEQNAAAAAGAASNGDSGGEEADGHLPPQQLGQMRRQGMLENMGGGVAMQRQDSIPMNVPIPP